MSSQRERDDRERIDAAFNRVLAAEAQSRERVADGRRAAAALVAAAQDQARAIAERTDRRVLRAHEIADAGVARALRELLAATTPDPDPAPDRAPPTAAEPTTDDPPSPPPHLDQALDTLIEEVLAGPRAAPR